MVGGRMHAPTPSIALSTTTNLFHIHNIIITGYPLEDGFTKSLLVDSMSMSFSYAVVQLADNLMMMYQAEAVAGDLIKDRKALRWVFVMSSMIILQFWMPVSVCNIYIVAISLLVGSQSHVFIAVEVECSISTALAIAANNSRKNSCVCLALKCKEEGDVYAQLFNTGSNPSIGNRFAVSCLPLWACKYTNNTTGLFPAILHA